MTIHRWWAAGLALTCAAGLARAQIPATLFASEEGDQPPVVGAERPVKPAASRVTAVTVYQGNALVTRTVEVPEGKGLVERHQTVYKALGDAMRVRVHALSLRTLTPAQ